MKYNAKPDHLYHRVAARIKTNAAPILDKLHVLKENQSDTSVPVGNLEPSLDILNMLVSTSAVEDYTDMAIESADPLGALFSQALLKIRTPPPVPISAIKRSRGRSSKGSSSVGPQQGLQYYDDPSLLPPTSQNGSTGRDAPRKSSHTRSFVPRTRRALAAAAEFEAEAGSGAILSRSPSLSPPPSATLLLVSPEPEQNEANAVDAEPTAEQIAKEAQRALRRERERAKREKLAARKERDRISRQKSRDRRKEQKRIEKEQRALAAAGLLPEQGTDTPGAGPSRAPVSGLQREAAALAGEVADLGGSFIRSSRRDREGIQPQAVSTPQAQADSSMEQLEEPTTSDTGDSGDDAEDAAVPPLHTEPVPEPKPEPIQPSTVGTPQVVDQVNSMQSFKMFNEGWVLPEGSSRRTNVGRTPSVQTSASSSRGAVGSSGENPQTIASRQRRGEPLPPSHVPTPVLITNLYL